MPLNVNHLLIFKKVADLGGFSAAATLLGLPKSSISQKITQLEQELGVRLLQRTTRRVSLTEAGERVYEASVRIASETDDIQALVQNMRKEPSGLLRVTAPHDLGIYLIEHQLRAFIQSYPSIIVEFDLSNRLSDLVKEGFDLALRGSSGGLQESSFVAKSIGLATMQLFVSPQWLTQNSRPTRVQELQHLQAVFFITAASRSPGLWQLEAAGKKVDIPVKAALRTNDLLAAKQAAIAGLGVALLPALICRPEIESGTLVKILPTWASPRGDYYALYPTRKYMPTKTRAFIEFLQQVLKSEGSDAKDF